MSARELSNSAFISYGDSLADSHYHSPNNVISQMEHTEYKLRVIRSYLTLPARLKRLEPWYAFRKPIEDQYRTRLMQISQIQGKKILRSIKKPSEYNPEKGLIMLQNMPEDSPLYDYWDEPDQPTTEKKSIITEHQAILMGATLLIPAIGILSLMQSSSEQVLNKLGEHTFIDTVRHELTKPSIAMSSKELGIIIADRPQDVINLLLNNHSFPACENTVGLYRDKMVSLLQDGFMQGKPWQEISGELNGLIKANGDQYPQYIYDRIARNETSRFANEGKIYAWEQAGIAEYDWIQGPGPCNEILICEQYAEGGPYPVGNGPMPIDDTHVNCLCELDIHTPEGETAPTEE